MSVGLSLPVVAIADLTSPAQLFRCAHFAATLSAGTCVARQSLRRKASAAAKDQSEKVPHHLEHCASGKCEQGNAVKAKLADYEPPAGDRARRIEKWRAQGPARLQKIEQQIAAKVASGELRPKDTGAEFIQRLPRAPDVSLPELDDEPAASESKEEEKDVTRHRCKFEGCGYALRSDNKSGLCAWHQNGRTTPRPVGWKAPGATTKKPVPKKNGIPPVRPVPRRPPPSAARQHRVAPRAAPRASPGRGGADRQGARSAAGGGVTDPLRELGRIALERIARGECIHCGQKIESRKTEGQCIYAMPCGHRQGTAAPPDGPTNKPGLEPPAAGSLCDVCGRPREVPDGCWREFCERSSITSDDEGEQCYRLGYEREKAAREDAEKEAAEMGANFYAQVAENGRMQSDKDEEIAELRGRLDDEKESHERITSLEKQIEAQDLRWCNEVTDRCPHPESEWLCCSECLAAALHAKSVAESALAEERRRALELIDELRCYTHAWDWKYGEDWDRQRALIEGNATAQPAPSSSVSEALTGKEGLEAPTREAPEPGGTLTERIAAIRRRWAPAAEAGSDSAQEVMVLCGEAETLRDRLRNAIDAEVEATQVSDRYQQTIVELQNENERLEALLAELCPVCGEEKPNPKGNGPFVCKGHEVASEQPRAPPMKDPSDSASLEGLRCHICGKPATCIGRYDNMESEEPACDECCGHGCEDGHCERIAEEPPAVPALPSGARRQETEQQTASRAADAASPSGSSEIAALLEEVHAAPPIAGPCPHVGFGPGACRGCVVLLVRAAEAARDARWREALSAFGLTFYPEGYKHDWPRDSGHLRALLGSVATDAQPPSSASGALAGSEEPTQETNQRRGAATRDTSNPEER